MIALSPDQVQALRSSQDDTLCVINPLTKQKYMLLPFEEYGRLFDEKAKHDEWTETEQGDLRSAACELLDSFEK
ncbi:MAG: hypothetical protein EXS16_07865 [Gemmataceae bacterium]|nr:hypothetical protein [Gemmataceae bacterium]